MKTYSGSLQRRGRRWYLVVHREGHQRWFALKTDKLPLARMRAARIAPADPNEERAWLAQLVREGERAHERLVRLNATDETTWENLAEKALAAVDAAASSGNRDCHAHWLSLIADSVRTNFRGAQPGTLTAKQAQKVVATLSGEYRSARRIVSFLRRSWAALGLDSGIWPSWRAVPPAATGGEHYRRVSVEEVRQVYSGLAAKDPPLADMVLIGHSTGLRLSDVAELTLSELALPFLRIVPNKTRKRKPNPLRIPLTPEALSVVMRLKFSAERKGEKFLFGEKSRHRPSRRIAAAFRRAGVLKEENGRASFHSLRATFISLMDEAGVPPHITDAITGHGGGGMHARYTQPSDEAIQSAVARAIPRLSDSISVKRLPINEVKSHPADLSDGDAVRMIDSIEQILV